MSCRVGSLPLFSLPVAVACIRRIVRPLIDARHADTSMSEGGGGGGVRLRLLADTTLVSRRSSRV